VVAAGSHGTLVSLVLAGVGAPVDHRSWFAMPMPAVDRLVFAPSGAWRSVHGPGLSVRLRGVAAPGGTRPGRTIAETGGRRLRRRLACDGAGPRPPDGAGG